MRSGSSQHLPRGRGPSAPEPAADSGAPRPYAKWSGGEILLPESLVAGATPGAPPARIDLPSIFGNRHPIEIEIGTGKGTFLLARASARPEMNFLGIEYSRPYAVYAADRFRRAGLTNVRMLRCEAGHFFQFCLADNSLWRVHIYFPDPWPKLKHHRRRLIQPAFIERARHALKLGGQLIVVTDHLDYFHHIQRVIGEAPGLAVAPMPRMADREGEVVGTNFERKYIAQGRPFYKIARIRYA